MAQMKWSENEWNEKANETAYWGKGMAKGNKDAPCENQESKEPGLWIIREIARDLGLRGEVHLFGSYASGLRTAGSDCDIVFLPDEETPGQPQDTPVVMLQRFAQVLPRYGFTNIATMFQAVVPLLKAVDPEGTDIDLSVGNHLGYHNSRLLGCYCRLDDRVMRLSHYVKQWARHYELISSSDGHINSYGYSLLVIFFLMNTSPPIVPNLQALAEGDKDPTIVKDTRWGNEQQWECGYWEEVNLVPRTWNTMGIEELLVGFFEFYLGFDWARHAVSIRLALKVGADSNGVKKMPDKFHGLHSRVAREVWYLEDPFDLGHNLTAKCTAAGRRRIWESMRQTHEAIKSSQVQNVLEAFNKACPKLKENSESQDDADETRRRRYLLKCRVHQKKVPPEAFAEAFSDYSVVALHFPQGSSPSTFPGSEDRQEAFLEFSSEYDRKQALTINETYCHGWQLRLFVTSQHALDDAKAAGAQFEKMPGWEAAKKEADNNDFQDFKGYGKQGQKGASRWKDRKGNAEADRHRRAEVEIALQKTRVIDGVVHADGLDELNVLLQRAQALSLDREVKKCEERMASLRAARGTPDGPPGGGRPGQLRGSPRMGPWTSPNGPRPSPSPGSIISVSSPPPPAAEGPGVQFQ